jgi:hypothetical protein
VQSTGVQSTGLQSTGSQSTGVHKEGEQTVEVPDVLVVEETFGLTIFMDEVEDSWNVFPMVGIWSE